MMAVDEGALICDLAETYGIFDYKQCSPGFIAILSSGLSDDSRIKKKMSHAAIGLRDMLLASIADRLSLLVWMQTKDGVAGRNKPQSILDKLMNLENESAGSVHGFNSAEEFKTWHKEHMQGGV